MSLLSSLLAGVTGMTAYGNAMSIIGNNIANVNTSGFKAGRPIFGDILSQSLGGPRRSAAGSRCPKVDTLFQQGSFSTTENITDMAIDGSGFFAVRNNNGTFFTRAGNFHFDSGGYLVNPESLALQGSEVINGNVTGSVGDIRIENLTGTPRATGDGLNGSTGVQVAANLDSRVAPPLPFSVSGDQCLDELFDLHHRVRQPRERPSRQRLLPEERHQRVGVPCDDGFAGAVRVARCGRSAPGPPRPRSRLRWAGACSSSIRRAR